MGLANLIGSADSGNGRDGSHAQTSCNANLDALNYFVCHCDYAVTFTESITLCGHGCGK
jgi:hypothetical protein